MTEEEKIIDPSFLKVVEIENNLHQFRLSLDNLQNQINQIRAKIHSLERKIEK